MRDNSQTMAHQELPTGLITFLFTDIEGSTSLWERHDQEMREPLARHDEILRTTISENNGVIVKTTGDGVHAAFASTFDALKAAVAAQRKLQDEAWPTIEPDVVRVRMGVHSGEAELRDGDYYGTEVNFAARLMAAGHGSQVLVSETVAVIGLSPRPDGFSFRDLGRYRLKGINEPQRVLQLNTPDLPSNFPESNAQSTIVRNLPGQTTPFVGRRHELAEIRRLLLETDSRLLTLQGSGGMGKTRTAIEASRSIAAGNIDLFPDGVTFIPLAPVDDYQAAVHAFAAALDYQFGGDDVPQSRQLLTLLSEKRQLLLIDNLEHLLGQGLAALIADILGAAPGVKLLVTSRERINLRAETVLILSGLDDRPQLAAAETSDEEQASAAVQLFLHSARRSVADFVLSAENHQVIAKICRLCGGMPLAIELAAAWLGLLTPKEIAAELEMSLDLLSTTMRDVPRRQRSLRAVFEGSWQRLSAMEQEAFLRLSVFRGGFQRAQGEAAGSISLPVLFSLVNKSFLQREGESRFTLHEQMRYFADERLHQDNSAWAAARQAHSQAYASFMVSQLPRLRGQWQLVALEEIEPELDNLRVAWEWLVAQGAFEELVGQMLPGLFRVAVLRLRFSELERLLESALERLVETTGGRESVHYVILKTAVIDSYFQQLTRLPFLYPGGRPLLQKLWPVAMAHKSEMGEWLDRFLLHHIFNVGQEMAYDQWGDHIAYLRSQGDTWRLAFSLLWFASALRLTEFDKTRPIEYLAEAITLFRQTGDLFETAQALFTIGWISEWSGDFDRAVENTQQAIQLLGGQGVNIRQGRMLHELQTIYLKMGQPRKGFSFLAEEQSIYRRLNRLDRLKESLHWESIMASRYSDMEHALRTRNESIALGKILARSMGREEAEILNWDYFELGELYRAAGDLAQARQYYEMAEAIFASRDDPKGHAFYRRAMGDMALAESQFDLAEAHYRFYLAHSQDTKSHFEVMVAHVGLARALRGLGRYAECEELLRESLVQFDDLAFLDYIMWPIVALAELKASQEEYSESALLAAYVLQHPFAWLEMRNLSEGVLHKIQIHLDPAFNVQTAGQAAARVIIPDLNITNLPPLS